MCIGWRPWAFHARMPGIAWRSSTFCCHFFAVLRIGISVQEISGERVLFVAWKTGSAAMLRRTKNCFAEWSHRCSVGSRFITSRAAIWNFGYSSQCAQWTKCNRGARSSCSRWFSETDIHEFSLVQMLTRWGVCPVTKRIFSCTTCVYCSYQKS